MHCDLVRQILATVLNPDNRNEMSSSWEHLLGVVGEGGGVDDGGGDGVEGGGGVASKG